MKIHEHRIFIISILFLVYLFSVHFFCRQFLGQVFFSKGTGKGFLSAHSLDKRNATYSYVLGRFYHYIDETPDLNRAAWYYRDSLRQSPLQGGCWLDLAKAYQAGGFRAEAGEALERAVNLTPGNAAVRWEAGIFFLINNNSRKAVENFREFIRLRPGAQGDVYDMVWKLSVDSHAMVKSLMPAEYTFYKGYLLYLISTKRVDESMDLWKLMGGFRAEDELYLQYTDFLISGHRYHDAEGVWDAFLGKRFPGALKDERSLIWNGSFEHEIQNRGFDWRIRETQGVDVFLDRDIYLMGRASLGIAFDGTSNPGIAMASQVVRVTPDAGYTFRGNVKTDSLTTKNGIFFSVSGHDCKGFSRRSEVITGTNFWNEISFDFDVPDTCSALSVSVGRDKSYKLDNKISGNVWIDDISLVRR